MSCNLMGNPCEKERESLIVSALKSAVENDGFKVLYQPILETESGKFIAAEALARLSDEHFSDIMPSEFIPVAERYGLIGFIGERVFKSVCKFYAENRLDAFGVSYVEVNLSVLQCLEKGLSEKFVKIMREYGVSAKHLNFEITESVAVDNRAEIFKNVLALKSSGATFAVDDFGTGFSDTEHLALLPVDVVKIDKSILWKAMDSVAARENLKRIITLLHERGLKTVAEGVETENMAALLKSLCCEFLQGFLFSRPLSEQEYLKFVKQI